MSRVIVLIIALMTVHSFSSAQNSDVVCGRVTAFNKYPVNGVKVSAKKSGAAANTGIDGKYCLVAGKNDKITFKADGFETSSKKIGEEDSVSINLVFKEGKKNIEKAVGYGYMQREDLLFAVNNLSEENNNFGDFTDIFNLIKGRFPGVVIRTDVNGNQAVVVRGGGIANNVTALYVLDGVVVDNIASISPFDVAAIDVLKDAGAAIYGSRGTNGVVLITTKSK
ncbi:MAG: TonB-dependent receptor plug domain-containing protein [Cyclobacteriaceae bacterium]